MFGSVVSAGRSQLARTGFLVLFGALFAFLAGYFVIAEQIRLGLAVVIALVLVGLATRSIHAAITGGIVYLVFMADVRRILIPVENWSSIDPLLMVGTVLAALLFAYAWSSESVKIDTPLAKWMLLLMGIMILQIFNPRQGGLIVGVAGALFFITPVLWFWIGRTYATTDFMKSFFFKTFMILAVLAALMGLYQTYFDYLPYQDQWYDVGGYIALGSRELRAPISFFSSSTEYGIFLAMAVIILWGTFLIRGKRSAPLLLPMLLFVTAIFLTGSRGPILFLLVTGAAMWAVLSKKTALWVPRGAIALVIGVVGLFLVLPQLEGVGAGHERIEHRIQRQSSEFNLIGEGSAGEGSAMNHFNMLIGGYVRSVQEPLGLGLGSMTRAAAALGDRGFGGTEKDLSDVAIALGVPGGVVYHIIVFLVFLTAVRYWLRTRNVVALCIMGILVFTFFGWLRGGRYAVSAIIWFCIGAMDRLNKEAERKVTHEEEEPLQVVVHS